jgi:multiple sugar transport system permease protein
MKAFFDTTPHEIEESAWIEGASVFKTFQKIILPLNTNGLVVTSVFIFIYTYIEYMYASIFTRADAITVPPFIVGFQTQFILKFQLMLSAALISMLPLAIFFLLIQRFIVKGITGGAIKE